MKQVCRLGSVTLLLIVMLQAGGCATKKPCSDVGAELAGSDEPPHACMVDGCSMAPDLDFGYCCDDHDQTYWAGGSAAERKQADSVFRACIGEQREVLAGIYYYGVRLGGTPYLPTPWRWGFGWDYPRGYSESPQ